MIKFPRQPIHLCMAGRAFFFELPFMNILMAINTPLCLCLIPFVFVALLTLRLFVFAY